MDGPLWGQNGLHDSGDGGIDPIVVGGAIPSSTVNEVSAIPATPLTQIDLNSPLTLTYSFTCNAVANGSMNPPNFDDWYGDAAGLFDNRYIDLGGTITFHDSTHYSLLGVIQDDDGAFQNFGPYVLPNGSSHTIAARWVGTTATFYLDGVAQGTCVTRNPNTLGRNTPLFACGQTDTAGVFVTTGFTAQNI